MSNHQQFYPRRTPFVKRSLSPDFEAKHGPKPTETQAERIAARLAQLNTDQTPKDEVA